MSHSTGWRSRGAIVTWSISRGKNLRGFRDRNV